MWRFCHCPVRGHPGAPRPDEGTERPRGERNADGSAERGFPGTGYEKYENDAAYVEKYDGEILKVSGYVTNIDNDFGVTISWRLGNVYTFTEDEIERMGGDEFFAANWDISVEFADESVNAVPEK